MLTTVLVSMFVASSAFAQVGSGIRCSWSTCYGDGAITNKNFACNSNSGSNVIVCSFSPTLTNNGTTNGNATVVDFQSQSSPLPQWWNTNVATTNTLPNTGCRGVAITVNATISPSAVNCLDEFNGGETIGLGGYFITATNRARIKIAGAVPQNNLASTSPGNEYFACNLVFSNAKTVGTGSCAGCTDPVCVVLQSIEITAGGGVLDEKLGNPIGAGQNIITWQGTPTGGCASVPTRNRTWGSIKSLYR